MKTVIESICKSFNVVPTNIAKKKRGDIREYTFNEIISRILTGDGSLAKDFPEFSKDTTSALLKKLFPGKTKVSQSWRAYLLQSAQLKRCSKCGQILNLNNFSINSKEPDGLRAHCKDCCKEEWKAHYDNHKEEMLQRAREYYASNKQERKEYNKAYYYANTDLYVEHRIKRQLREKDAIANWANLEEINKIYSKCPEGYHVDHIIPLQGKSVCGLHTENNLQYLSPEDNLRKSNSFDIDTHAHRLSYITPYL